MVVPAVWLRDHCMSPEYYNHETQQKNADPNHLTRNLKIDSVELTDNDCGFTIFWNDGHVSKFAMDWLQGNYYKEKPDSATKRVYWDKNLMESQPLPIVPHEDHMKLEAGLAETVSNLCKYGFSIVEGCKETEEATEKVVERLSFVQETLFGKMWTFTSDGLRSDTAYSTQALGSHTDLSYMETPAGIQVFHCLKHTGSGGETLLVDGFHALDVFREAYPEDFELLTKIVVPHEYKEEPSDASPGYHLYSLGTTVRIHPASGEFIQLRYVVGYGLPDWFGRLLIHMSCKVYFMKNYII
ncbi:trimethyllysine dioxygenase, mitochondrial [Elysia marginata]|uniref:trimethyllysine dioxygenase n=1 Tax=Elysia marginata TaxID=1093978 RepID=A0AAV4FK66_9GAST|nr:trimethyllysine dioxygenase, mitochondrial [Elysia marginata]